MCITMFSYISYNPSMILKESKAMTYSTEVYFIGQFRANQNVIFEVIGFISRYFQETKTTKED